MSHVSRKRLKKNTLKRITGDLIGTLTNLRGSRGQKFLAELLTPTEQLMLAKRLALVAMLQEGYSYYRIQKALKMSTSTIKRVHAQLYTNAFRTIQTTLKQKKERKELWRMIEKFSRGGLPPKGARWKTNR